MSIDFDLVWAAIAGAGTVLGTIVAAERYVSAKFKGAVVGILRELEYDRQLRHLQRELKEQATLLSKLQDVDVELQGTIDQRFKELDAKINRVFGVLNAQKIAQVRLENTTRLLGTNILGEASISALLMNDTNG